MDLKVRITELASAVGVTIVSPDQCWVDSRVRCPYGSPEGSYSLRPEMFCTKQCSTFADNHVKVCSEDDFNEGVSDGMRTHFDTHRVSVSSELRAQADKLAERSPQRLVLDLAASILEDDEAVEDRDVLLEDDLPDEMEKRKAAATK